MTRRLRSLTTICASVALGSLSVTTAMAAQTTRPAPDPQFATFIPGATPNADGIDYSIWDEAMRNIVVSMGPSLRQSAGIPQQSLGTRLSYGHTSRYRLEGSRIMFTFLNDEVINSFTVYRKDLEETASKIDIQALSRNEQLAFWFNLHNVAMIEQIARAWPIRQPREIELDGVPLDQAPFITVEGVAMSPRDIREKIVYANWRDPRVIYGFWNGEIGGPSIQKEAFNSRNLNRLLNRSARDFVNSLRGTQKRGDVLEVNDIYEQVAPFFFPDFATDLRAHVAEFANDDTREILGKTQGVRPSLNEHDIADLAGGVREPSYVTVYSDDRAQGFRIPQSMMRLLEQRQEKYDRIIRRGERTGTVTFSNIDLPGEAGEAEEIE